jgi:hypothetical protein
MNIVDTSKCQRERCQEVTRERQETGERVSDRERKILTCLLDLQEHIGVLILLISISQDLVIGFYSRFDSGDLPPTDDQPLARRASLT